MATTLLFLSYLIITTQSTILCDSGDCNIDCDIENCDTVICTDTASSCNIKCSAESCKDSKFHLSASNSNMVHCTETNSCQQISIECGISKSDEQLSGSSIPIDYKYEDFDGDINECIIILPNNIISNLAKIECHDNVDICQWTDDNTNTENANDFKCIGIECISVTPNRTSNPTISSTKEPYDEEIFAAEDTGSNSQQNASIFNLNTTSILISISVGICCGLFGICCCVAICRKYHLRVLELNHIKSQQKAHKKGYQSPSSLNRNKNKNKSFPAIKHSKMKHSKKRKSHSSYTASQSQKEHEIEPSDTPSNNESSTIQIKIVNPAILKPPSSRISQLSQVSTVDLDADANSTISKLSPGSSSKLNLNLIPNGNGNANDLGILKENANKNGNTWHRPHITIHSIASLGGIPSVPKSGSLTTTTYTTPTTMEVISTKDDEDKLLHERMITAVNNFNQMMVIEKEETMTRDDDESIDLYCSDDQHDIDITPSGSQESF